MTARHATPHCLTIPQTQLRVLASLVALVAALNAPRQINPDTWFNLVLGREIASTGLVTRNDLTLEAAGVPWIDQQWLAHLIHYGLARLVGLPGLVLVASLIACVSLLAASSSALRAGASPGRTLLAGTLALGALMPQSVRAQAFTLPLLALFLCRLERDARQPERRSWWLVPCAALWANLHGSALLAPALGLLLAGSRALDALRARRAPDPRQLGRDLLLAACLGVALLVSPYGFELLDYYASILGNPAFRSHVGEWGPLAIASEPTKSAVIAVALGLALLGGRRARTFPLAVCVGLALLTLRSARHATPLALALAAFLPAIADAALGSRLRLEADAALSRSARFLLPVGLIGASVAIPSLAAQALRVELPSVFTDRVAQAAAGNVRVLADEQHADRLLWFHPELKGRLSHDVRFEILPAAFIESLTQLYGFPETPRSQALLSRYELVVVDREEHAPLWEWLRRDPGWQELAADGFATAFRRR